jgi:glycosyltransferase involved in cell wall biosynthesis
VYETTYPEFKGGVERWYSELSQGLAMEGFEVTYLNTIGKQGYSQGIRYLPMGDPKRAFHQTGKRSALNIFTYSFRVFISLRKMKFKAIYLSSFPYLHIWAAKLSQFGKKEKSQIYVDWFELPSYNYWKNEFGLIIGVIGFAIQSITVRISDVNVTYLNSMYSQLSTRCAKNQLILKLPGICIDELVIPEKSSKNPKTDICQIGRLTPDKQPLLALEVVQELTKGGWKGRFHLIGSGPLLDQLNKFIGDHDLSRNVQIHEKLDNLQKNELLQKCGLLLHPSKREGFGLVIVEAAAVGVPAVLVRSTDNKSTELAVNPSLISESSSPIEIARLAEQGLREHVKYSNECLEWNLRVRPTMMARDSILELTENLKARLG